jgi:carboxyl-terminal processing protease
MPLKKYAKRTILLALVVTVGLFAFKDPGDKYFAIAKNMDIFATLFKEVNTYYVDEVNPNKLMKTGIEAMLKSLDPYTNYIPEDDIEDYRTMTTGQYGGIGSIIGTRNGNPMILMPYSGSPADKSGLKIGDVIKSVDGIDVTDKGVEDISKLLKGQARTDLTINIQRYGEDDEQTIELTRERITIDNIPYFGMVNDNIGYIRLANFTTGAGREVENALKDLKKEGAEKIVFDLRGNPGGLLSEAVNVSNVFVDKGKEIVSTKGKVTDWNKTYRALNGAVDTEIPVAVLTSSRSASAAEIVSGVIQDYDRGVLIGNKTFGKGLVQATRPLTYNAQLKITTAKYYIPSGRCIQAIDYSNRSEDGSVGKIPDSLKVEFKTINNERTVYDGGGIDPDIEVEGKSLAPITISLLTKNLIFDYATEYYYTREALKDPKSFTVNDAEYSKFVNWLSDKEYDYTTRVEHNIDDLIKAAKNEKYYDAIEERIEALREKVKHNKETDLQTFKEEIVEQLEEELASRYFLQEGTTEASFDDDPVILEAVSVLEDTERYNSILQGSI